jgi:hypothetical protein
MSRELERALERALEALPGPSREAEGRARRAALDALPPPPRRPRFWRAALPLVAVASALAAGGAALAAGGGHLPLVASERPHPTRPPVHGKQPPAPPHISLPPGARGFSTFAGGRLWLATRHGLALNGLRFSAAAVSPRALYVSVGIGHQLVTMAADGSRVAWAHPAGGRPVAASWAPYPTRIAYVVRAQRRFALHLIWGNGLADRLLDGAVAPVTPAWRPDSQALAYAGAGGGLVVRDLVHERAALVARPGGCRGRVRRLSWSPDGGRLAAVLASGRLLLASGSATGKARCLAAGGSGLLAGWLGAHELLVLSSHVGTTELARLTLSRDGVQRRVLGALAGRARALVVGPDGRSAAIALARGPRLEVVLVSLANRRPRVAATLLGERVLGGAVALGWQ